MVHGILRTLAACLAVCVSAPSFSQSSPSQSHYPRTRTDEVVHDYHGTRVPDPFNWLEDLSSKEVVDWAEAQTEVFNKHVRRDPLRAVILSRMNVLGSVFEQAAPAVSQGPSAASVMLGSSVDGRRRVLMLTSGATSGRKVIGVDPAAFGPDRDITRIQISPDGRYVAYEISEKGSEWTETRVFDAKLRQSLKDLVTGLLFEPPVWTRDSAGFFYVHNKRPASYDARHVTLRSPSVRYHRVNTPQLADKIVYSTPADTTDLVLEVELTDDGKRALIFEGTGAHQSDVGWISTRVFQLDLHSASQPVLAGKPTAVTERRDAAYRVVESTGSAIKVITDSGAPRRRFVEINLQSPHPRAWREIIPEDRSVLQRIKRIGDKWVALYLTDAQHQIRVFDKGGLLLRRIQLPPFSNVSEITAGDESSSIRVTRTSFLQPPIVSQHDLNSGAMRIVHAPKGSFPHDDYEVRQEWYSSKDGTRVPTFIVHRRGLRLDGSHSVWMLGYGASGTPMLPDYAESVLAWLDLGGIFAMPSLRGGGEFGRGWYEAATRERKQTSFDDFAAAGEHLVRRGYTSPSKLAVHGASNGGLLVAASMTQRPDLFGVAVVEVPLTDAIRGDRGRHRAQFGASTESGDFPFLYAYSPLHRVQAGRCYPATLVTGVLNDDRAPAWHAMKFAAALQKAQSCDNPILLRVDKGGGHSGYTGPESWKEQAADALTMMARHTRLVSSGP